MHRHQNDLSTGYKSQSKQVDFPQMFFGISLNCVKLSSPLHPSEILFKDQCSLHLSSSPRKRCVGKRRPRAALWTSPRPTSRTLVSAASETPSAGPSPASGGDEEEVCFHLKVLHSRRSHRAVPCVRLSLCAYVCACEWVRSHCVGLACVCVCVCGRTYRCVHICVCLPEPGEARIVLSRTALVESGYQSHVRRGEEERRRGGEAMINGWGTRAEISGAVCKAVAFCLMWNKRTTVTRVPASLHSRTAALRTHTAATENVWTW